MRSLIFKNLLFTLLQPGIVAGVIPLYFLNQQPIDESFTVSLEFTQWISVPILLSGMVILCLCIFYFIRDGKGTLSPAVPTKKLVICGLYRYSRNPMYVGVLSILTGEALLLKSPEIGIYTLIILTAFHLFITGYEEPRLKKDFDKDYDDYMKRVRRWL